MIRITAGEMTIELGHDDFPSNNYELQNERLFNVVKAFLASYEATKPAPPKPEGGE